MNSSIAFYRVVPPSGVNGCEPLTCRRGTGRGFTLIEILVVTAIVGLVVAAVAACISAGLRVWESAQTMNNVERESHFALETIKKDLMNSFPFYGLPFDGAADKAGFPGAVRVNAGMAGGGGLEEKIGRIEYGLDGEKKAFLRKEQVFPLTARQEVSQTVVAEGVVKLRFQYMDLPGQGSGAWLDRWTDPTNHPAAVRVELFLAGTRGQIKTERVIVLPDCGHLMKSQAAK